MSSLSDLLDCYFAECLFECFSHCVVVVWAWTGPGADVWDDRGVLGPWCRGPSLSRLCGRADLPDPPAQQCHYLGLPGFYGDFGHQCGLATQRVQYLSPTLIFPVWNETENINKWKRHTIKHCEASKRNETSFIFPDSVDLRQQHECSCYFIRHFLIIIIIFSDRINITSTRLYCIFMKRGKKRIKKKKTANGHLNVHSGADLWMLTRCRYLNLFISVHFSPFRFYLFLFFCLLDKIACDNQQTKQPSTMLDNTIMLQNLGGTFKTVTHNFPQGTFFCLFVSEQFFFPWQHVLYKTTVNVSFYGTNGCL